jgi:chaperone required for assembly of F1-ATPase
MSEWAPKVFWTTVEIGEDQAGFKILLDGRALKTPSKAELLIPSRAMAEEIAKEWRLQEDKVDPSKLPLTKLAYAAIDKLLVQRDPIIEILAEYATTDLLCYRTTSPAGLADRQEQIWQPLLDWFEETHQIHLRVGSGVMPVQQSADVLERCEEILKSYSHFELAAVHDLIQLSGSFVIGLATVQGKLSVSDAWTASRIDEDWQIEEWGEDEEASSLAATRRKAFEHASFVLSLFR